MGFPLVPAKRNPYTVNKAGSVTFTVGAETGGNTIIVTGQVKDPRGATPAERLHLRVYLSDVATGAGVTAVAPSGAVAISGGFGAIILTATAKLVFDIVTDAAGKFALSIVEAGAKTLYVVAVMPDGSVSVSGAVTFA